MKKWMLLLLLAFAIPGCGQSGGDAAHTDDPTPGGEATPPTEELINDPAAFDNYAAEQSKKAAGQ